MPRSYVQNRRVEECSVLVMEIEEMVPGLSLSVIELPYPHAGMVSIETSRGEVLDEGRAVTVSRRLRYVRRLLRSGRELPHTDPCFWCGQYPVLPGDVLCIRCWGAKTAGLSRKEALS